MGLGNQFFIVPTLKIPARFLGLRSRSVVPAKAGNHTNRPPKATLKNYYLTLKFYAYRFSKHFNWFGRER